jgi:hypothetical protein
MVIIEHTDYQGRYIMFISKKILCLTTLTLILVGCGGSTNNSTRELEAVASIAPPEFSNSEIEGSSLRLRWGAIEGATGYRVYYSNDADFLPEDLADSTLLFNTPSTYYKIEKINRSQNHYFFLQSIGENIESELSQKYVAFSFLELSSDSTSIAYDYINDLEWKRCREGQVWDNSSSTCIGSGLMINPSDALAMYSNPDSDGWTLPVFGNTSSFSMCSTVRDEGNSLSNLLLCKNNDELLIRAGSFNQMLNNPYYNTSCKDYLNEFIVIIRPPDGYSLKGPSSCSSSLACSTIEGGTFACSTSGDFKDRGVLLNREI